MLDKLNDVQSLDLRLDGLDEEKAQTPPELIEIRKTKLDLERRLAARQQEHHALRQRVSANELDLQSLQQRRKSATESALQAISTKEASQYQNQELQFATRIQELEEDTLPLMEQLETLGEQVAELEAQLGEVEPELERLATEEEERVSAIESSMAEIRTERKALSDEIDANLLRQYEQVRRSRRGVGLVDVVDNKRCGGCNVQLPIHVVQKARKPDAVVRCPSCGRILWAKDG